MGSSTLTKEEVERVKRALYTAKFALEQSVKGKDKDEAVDRINEALNLMRDR